MKGKLRLLFVFIMVLTLSSTPLNGFGEEQAGGAGKSEDISKVIKDVQMISKDVDRFGKPAVEWASSVFKIKLAYNQDILGRPIAEGEKLSIKLVPVDASKSFINMEYKISQKTELVDGTKNPPFKVASLDMKGRRGVDLTFKGGSEEFEALLELPFQLKNDAIFDYFQNHPGEEETNFQYKLQINGKDVPDKVFEFTVKKPELKEKDQEFYKTSGTYEQEGELGDGNFHFNINISTKLRSPNEYVIYDLPDVNLGFEGNLGIYDGHVSPFGKTLLDSSKSNIRNEATDSTGSKIKVYDVYFLTEEPASDRDFRVSAWEEKTLQFHRDDVPGNVIDSMAKATVPKNILFEKLAGEKLTPEEEQLIKDNGGLYKKVGKGFKVTISDYKSNYFDRGGWLTLVYRMEIKNPSPKLDSKGRPMHRNFATFYAQEIPNCNEEDETCTPIDYEKNKKDDNGSPNNPIDVVVEPGTIGATVTVPPVSFTKVEADSEGNPMENKPLSGAKFNIYKLDQDGKRQGIASNKEGVELKDLITNKDGKLTKDDKVIKLSLDTGYYQFEETNAPEGYKVVDKNTNVTVGYKALKVLVTNKKEANYRVTYEFKSTKASMPLPQEVMQLLPIDDAEYRDGLTLSPMQPASKKVKVADGTWVFKGYDKEKDTINKADLHFIGMWDFEKGSESQNSGGEPGKPKEKDSITSPNTGDSTMVYAYISLCTLALSGIYIIRKKAKNSKIK